MNFDQAWVEQKNPCKDALTWLRKKRKRDATSVIGACIKEKHWDWAEWGISRSLTPNRNALWAIYCAEQVLPIFDKQYPNDDRPRKAIEAAKKAAEDPSDVNKEAADAARAAADAARAADAADAADAAWSADAARAAADAARAADAADAARAAAWSAAWSADDHDKMRTKCILFGLKLLNENQK